MCKGGRRVTGVLPNVEDTSHQPGSQPGCHTWRILQQKFEGSGNQLQGRGEKKKKEKARCASLNNLRPSIAAACNTTFCARERVGEPTCGYAGASNHVHEVEMVIAGRSGSPPSASTRNRQNRRSTCGPPYSFVVCIPGMCAMACFVQQP